LTEKKKEIRSWQRTIHRLASRPKLTSFLSNFIHYLDKPFLRLTKGEYSFSGFLAGWPVVELTTIGAKSGLIRRTALVGIPDGENIILIASNFGKSKHPAWYHNLVANPQAKLTFNGQTRTYTARLADSEERKCYWRLAEQVYLGFPLYKERAGDRRIPILVLSPS
jgi:deazaflavin-dependent oxidoreductase (nitroreductase family)